MRERPHIGATSRREAGPQIWSARPAGIPFTPRWQPNVRSVRHKLALCPEIDCIRHLLPPGILAAAELRAIEIGTSADRVLIAQNAISDEQYVRALALSLGTGYDSLSSLSRAACHGNDLDLIESAKTGILWLAARERHAFIVAPHGYAARHLVNKLRLDRNISAQIRLTTSRHLSDFVTRQATKTIAQNSAYELKTMRPEFSAGASRSSSALIPAAGCSAAVAAFASMPALTTTAAHIALTLVFLGWGLLRIGGILTSALMTDDPWPRYKAMTDESLPTYSIIIALYHESATVEGLVKSLKSFDYPLEKLDIKLVLEPDDRTTRQALARVNLGSAITIVTAPNSGPRTKPKALNAALPFVRGTYVAVFDAEDRPEADQLKKALHAFQNGDSKLACVQARLTIDNAADSWFTRMFAAEYAGLFDVFLPGIAAWRLPLPLGGSSNHFRTSILREAGAWDPYNVTEDADLGMRLARLGYHTAVIDSTTYEEAPSRFMPWLKQRTRWFKGWMQTWLVHMRHPLRLWRDLGTSGFMVFQLVVGGSILAAMVHGVFAVAFGWQIAASLLWAEKPSLGENAIAILHAATLVSGYVISGALAIFGLARRRRMPCAWALMLMPLYWLLLSIAAWRALFHLLLSPYTWEKTEHDLARIAPHGTAGTGHSNHAW